MSVLTYEPDIDSGSADRFAALVGEPPVSTFEGLTTDPIQFQFAGSQCFITYSKLCVVDADKAREFLGGLR